MPGGIFNVDKQHTRSRTMKLGLTWHEEDANVDDGFIIFSSIYPEDPNHNYVRILNMNGEQVHSWDLGTRKPGLWSHLPDPECTKRYQKSNNQKKGLLLAVTKLPDADYQNQHEFLAFKSDCGGSMSLIDFDGNKIWEHKDEYQHHDARLTKQGNLIYLANEVLKDKSKQLQIIATAARHREFPLPKKLNSVYSDVIKVVDPETGKELWRWKAGDHFDPSIDTLNFNDPFDEWNHGNTIVPLYENENEPNDVSHILASFRQISTIVKIDVKTGEFIRLLKSPFISQQHDCSSIIPGNTDRILVFDNRYSPNDLAPSAFSRVIEYDLTQEVEYPLLPIVKGPKIHWVYVDGVVDFYSAYISGAQRLPNWSIENDLFMYTLITEGMKGRIFLVKTELAFDDEGKPILNNRVIWEYMNPEIADGENRDVILGRSSIFRSRYISKDMFTDEQLSRMHRKTTVKSKL